ncbi:MAG TPA: hypothetical protein VI455_04255 [Terriglobia bacterium]
MRRWIVYLAWAWEIIVGGLLITPGGIICIACGTPLQAPGYIGETATWIVGVVAILLGVFGIVTAAGARTGSAGSA